MIDFDVMYRLLPKPRDRLLSVYHLLNTPIFVSGLKWHSFGISIKVDLKIKLCQNTPLVDVDASFS